MDNLTLSIKTRFLLNLNPSNTIGQTWGPGETLTPDQPDFVPNDNNLLQVLSVPLVEVQNFAGTCAWVYHVAHFVFGVQGTLWINNGNVVNANTPLAAADYVFEPNNQTERSVFLMRYFSRSSPVVPKPGTPGGGVKTDFSGRVQLRENQLCKISGFSRLYGYKDVCSHLIPKRLGPHGVNNIILRYTGALPNWQNNRPDWDCRVAVLLYGALDGFVDSFTMGFYNPYPNASQYQIHQFHHPTGAANQDLANLRGWTRLALRWDTIVGSGLQVGQNEVDQLNLHGSTVNFPAGGNLSIPNPPFEVLGWHYVQCVLRKWSTATYRDYRNINW